MIETLWNEAAKDDWSVSKHLYCSNRKIRLAASAGRVTASGEKVGQNADCIVVPIRSIKTGELQAVQLINIHGAKEVIGDIEGGCLLMGNTTDRRIWHVTDSWAEAYATVYGEPTGEHDSIGCCAVCFEPEYKQPVAEALQHKYKQAQHIRML